MFRPHNRIFLQGQASRTERKKKKKEEKEKERSRHSVDAGDLAEGNKNKTSLEGFHGLLTAQRNSTRDFSPRLLLPKTPPVFPISVSFHAFVHLRFLTRQRGLTRLRVNVNFLTEEHDLCPFNRVVA